MMLRPLLAASAVLLVALPARAERANDAATLEYLPSRATVALCPKADFLVLEVRVRLGYELFQPSAPNHLTVKIDRANGRFRSIGEIRDDDGKVIFARTYSEIDCTAALFSMAMSVSIEFTRAPEDPAPSLTKPPPPSPQEPPPSTPECPEPEPPPPPAPPVPARRRVEAGVATVFALGTAPSVLGGVGWFVGVRWPSVSLALEGRALFAPSATLARPAVRSGYSFGLAAVSGTACYQPAWVFLCARAEIGSLFFDKAGADVIKIRRPVDGFGFRGGVDRALTPRLAIRVYAEVSFQLLQATVRATATNTLVWSQSFAAGSLGAGPVFTFSEF